MKRPQYVFRPNLNEPQHRRAWALLQQVPPAKRKEFLVQSILAAEQTDRLEKSIRKVVREELQAVNITGAVPSPLSENAITIRSNIIAGAIFKILSRSFYAEILALQGLQAGLRDSYFIRDNFGYPEFRNNQTFSVAGARRGFSDPRGTLFFEIARLVEARHPAYLILENVPGLLSHSRGETYATILNTLDRLGYGVEWQCLNSKDFGVPQSRNRVYIVGYLDERCRGKVFPFTETTGTALIQKHGGPQGKRVYSPEGLSCTLASTPGGFGGKTGLYEVGVPIKCASKTGYQLAQVGDSIDLSYATVNSRRGRVGKEIAHTLTTGCRQGTVEVRPVKNPIKSDLARNTERTGKPGAPMHTLTTKDRHGVLCEGRIRRLTPRECLRLQGWADDRIDTVLAIQSDNQAYKQAGNGVTVNVVEAIGRRIAKMDAELRGEALAP